MAFSVSICPSLPPFLLQIFSKNHFRLSLLVSCFDYNYASWFWKALSNLENKKTMRFSPQSTRRRVLTKVARHPLLKSRHMPCPATHCYTLSSGWKKSHSAYFSCLQLPFWGINHHGCLFGFDCDSAILFCFQLHFLLATLNSYAVIRSVDMGYWNIQLVTIKLLLEE